MFCNGGNGHPPTLLIIHPPRLLMSEVADEGLCLLQEWAKGGHLSQKLKCSVVVR